MKKLIPMVDFVLNQNKPGMQYLIAMDICINYAKFLKQYLELWMFIPCDVDGNIIEEITQFDPDITSQYYASQIWHNALFEDAKKRVLFEGFEIKSNPRVESFKYIGFEYYEEPLFIIKSNNEIVRPLNKSFHTIEDLVNRKKILTLTSNAIKNLGL